MNTEERKRVRLILIPAGATDWTDQDRIRGNIDLPLSTAGTDQVTNWISQLANTGIKLIYAGKLAPSSETAKRFSKSLKIKARFNEELDEVNLGLWQGMLIEDLQDKQPKVYRQWLEQPEKVVPPSGESLKSAQDRLMEVMTDITAKGKADCIAVVLGELSLGLVALKYQEQPISKIWEFLKQNTTWHEFLV